MGAGWRWSIGLQNRRGTGYVFSSAFTSDEEAERELRAALGPAAEGQTARFLPMRVGYNPEAWTGNCVAVGLAAGFLEPLEATGIYLIEVGARILAEHLPLDGQAMPALAASYNRIVGGTFHEIADFITLHYALSRREDTPFWRAVGNRRVLSDGLRSRLELWDERPPRDFDLSSPLGTYQAYSWECVLYGMGWRPRRWGGLHGSAAAEEDVERTFAEVRAARKRSVADLADHAHFLKNYR
jgi:tryptophan halogenase